MLRQNSIREQNRLRSGTDASSDAGFSLVEIMAASLVLATLAGLVVIIVGNLAGHYRLSGDARGVSNSVAVAKLRAASLFTQTRLNASLSSGTYKIQTWRKTGTPGWQDEGTVYALSNGVGFGFASVGTPPPIRRSRSRRLRPARRRRR
jgi:Tfp pilus assembly protein FimT